MSPYAFSCVCTCKTANYPYCLFTGVLFFFRCIPPFSAMSRNRDLHYQTRMFRSCVCAPLQATGDVMVVCVTPLVMRVESAEASSHATNPKQLALLSASLVGRGVVSALKQLQLISCSELTRVR